MCADKSPAEAGMRDYKDTLLLPKTEFPTRPSHAVREPAVLESWGNDNGYSALRNKNAGRETFTLHDGPPYANGHLHMGHVLNKVLKDLVNRSQSALGKQVHYRPGWDCHGLPIEWKVEEEYRGEGVSKEEVPVLDLREACRRYAGKWVDVQRDEFRRLGVMADWENPYLTMSFNHEAAIAREFLSLVEDGYVYHGQKPMTWSPVEKTVLAEAELEYHEKKSTSVWLSYRAVYENGEDAGFSLLAWTTTPWTVPAGTAVAYGPDVSYGLWMSDDDNEEYSVQKGDAFVLADKCAEMTMRAMGVHLVRTADFHHDGFRGLSLKHPLSAAGHPWLGTLPCVQGGHVGDEVGTGLVHTAPSHGMEDYQLGQEHGLRFVDALDGDGRLDTRFPHLDNAEVVLPNGKDGPANRRVTELLSACGTLKGRKTVTHQYPHSWRSKAPVLFRTTGQWFARLGSGPDGHKTPKDMAMEACEEVLWKPESGKSRMTSMLSGRPDWVLSRQRTWGVPLPLFTRKDREPGEADFLLVDHDVNEAVVNAFHAEGGDAWYKEGAKERFLSVKHNPDDYEQCFDVLDVWFDSGASHSYALDNGQKADLYLEGTDQHRGWFQHAMLHGVMRNGEAPFRAVMTHGFVMGDKGQKMSKSAGDTVLPEKLVEQYGADVLRLWVASSDTSNDVRFSGESMAGCQETYRKFRNTVRYMMGVLADGAEMVVSRPENLPALETWVLHRCSEVHEEVHSHWKSFDFPRAVQAAMSFCAEDLSSFYLDLRKDVVYCDERNGDRRQAALYTMSVCLSSLLSWMGPVCVFACQTARDLLSCSEEDMDALLGHLPAWKNDELAPRISVMKSLRKGALSEMEARRREGVVTRNERMVVSLPDAGLSEEDAELLRETLMVAEVRTGQALSVWETSWHECPRCRRSAADVLPDNLCQRCEEVLQQV